ncbi:hypothetical protein [Dasania marina]|mgnify:CR=1 FL=1|uniref:hypothetical protein n=1 Tax=Dasania marina TaxID=471499 RepID=UPI0030DBF2AF|tara:strand:+ start:114157 stop:116040 length:1884 start_codon:yes stop_codon:yes gene_type:complete
MIKTLSPIVAPAWLMLSLTASPLLHAQTDCISQEQMQQQQNSERAAKRRRPGKQQAVLCESEKGEPEQVTQQQEYVRSKRAPVAADPRQTRRKNPVSPIPRPGIKDYTASVPLPDRWRIVDALGYEDNWFDPYHRNTLKGDKPVYGDDWFFNLGIISDSVYEIRQLPTPVGASSSNNSGDIDVYGSADQWLLNQNLALEFVWYKGDTVFRPPDYEFRIIPVINYNEVHLDEVQGINVDPADGDTRYDGHIGLQAAFADVHLRNVSDKFDFDSIRVGIQPFSSDFRGFLFQDNQLGIRLFGNRDNNIFQYNLAVFQRMEKDTNSGLNDHGKSLRDDYVFAANLYWQDLLVKGFMSQFTIVHNKNGEEGEFFFDNNEFIARPASLGREVPRGYDVTYLGYNGDGHIGRLNLTTSAYYAFGSNDPGVFVDQKVDIESVFFAAEASMDFDWFRPRLSFLYGSGDDDPYDDKATGFDAIFENPQFSGSDTSYWIRQPVPLIGGGRVSLSSRNGVLNSMRSSKELGQSNFTNPGIILIGAGFDMDLLPELRLSGNVNQLYFDDTAVLEVARNQSDIADDIGLDVSLSLTYRPFMTQNIVFRGSYARLIPGEGYDDLYEDDGQDYFLFNLVLAY